MKEILVRGVEMPLKDDYKIIVIYGDGTVSDYHVSPYEKDIMIGTATEIPDHGRLGDLDRLESNLRLCAKYQEGYRQQGILGCCETIRMTSAVIPASK